ncbi:hypothetical protein JJB09_02240 [Rhizobium sp. KVB221]|uniref:Thiol:disulfide interchange protein DsbD N-terminal domain-containing protein n=1 Tax=Rhizobium setariae TaxID=2801340 RepID=A0A937CN71_9HYPH|nr:protein-disulfide reductase DsbD domain-containing protein [Rhizobium setariae]MBL0370838.1 hypothetical protein [Rhizobium setariae]
MKTRCTLLITTLCMLASTIVPTHAAVSDWVHSEGGKARLSALSDGADGKITAILEIDPAPGWKTYWQNPGDAGLAPQIDLSAGRNLKLVKVSYPAPEIGNDEGGRFLGYHKPVTLVLELVKPVPADPAELDATILIGLCKDICLPFQATFNLPLADASQPQADEFMKIQMAKAELPDRPSPGFDVPKAGLTADKTYFEATIVAPEGAPLEIAISPSGGLQLGVQEKQSVIDGKTVVRYPVTRLPTSLEGANVTMVVKAAGRSIETTLSVD